MIYGIILTVLFSIVQISILRSIAIFQITPDIVLSIIVYIALFFGESALWFGFFAGFFMDICNLSLGYNTLLLSLIGYTVGFFAPRLYKETPLLWILLLSGTSIFRDIVIMLLQRDFTFYFLIRYIIPSGIYTALAGIVIFYVLRITRLGTR